MKIETNKIEIFFAIILFLMVLGYILLPVIDRPRRDRISQCKRNLRQIGLALSMYAYKNNEKYPNDLLELFPKYFNDYKVLICREGQKGLKRNLHDKETNYIYLPGLTAEAPDDCIVIFDEKNNHDNGRNVLYLDAHTTWSEENEFKQELKRMLDDPTHRNQYSEKALDIMNRTLKQE